MPTVVEAFNLALQHHEAGRLPEAEALYRQVLQAQPDHPDALHNLGMIACQVGRYDVAVDCIGRAIAGDPSRAEFCNNLGDACRRWGKLDEALASYQRAVALNPGLLQAITSIGGVLRQQGRLGEAAAHYRQMLGLYPESADLCNNLGNVLQEQGHFEDAVAQYRQAIALRPDYAEAHHNMAGALYAQGKLEEAAGHYQQALAIKSDYVEACVWLGKVRQEQGRHAEAVGCYQRALALGAAGVDVSNYLGVALEVLGRQEEAIAAYQQALALKPDYAEVHVNLGMALLRAGDFSRGFTEYEWRWRVEQLTRNAFLNLPQPFWDGSELNGKTILLYPEQGFGDTIQFVRYAPLVAGRGGRVIVACTPELVRLLASVAGIAQVVSDRESLPEIDLYAPLLSLPRIFGTTLETIPSQCPYLTLPEPNLMKVEVTPDVKLKVGIVWAGRPTHKNDQNRSCPLSCFLGLADQPGVALFSLQKQPVSAHLGTINSTMPIRDLSDQIIDFADTASFIAQLDLIITVDTAVAHLAGALGRPVWVLLPFWGVDWRWMRDRESSPWYPTMRLFRQEKPGDWSGIFARVAETLQVLVSAGHPTAENKRQ